MASKMLQTVRTIPRGYLAYFFIALVVVAAGALVNRDSFVSYLSFSFGGIRFIVWAFPVLLWYGAVSIKLAVRKVPKPTKTLLRLTRANAGWLIRGTILLAVYIAFSNCATVIKTAIPAVNPFYADIALARIDHAIFGTDPWRITHSLIGPFGTLLIDRAYALWFFAMLATLGWLAFTRDQFLQQRGFLALALAWSLLGCVLATSLASVGPYFFDHFYHSARFQPLVDQIQQVDKQYPLLVVVATRYLLAAKGSVAIGTGISAMPSLHVSLALLYVFVVRSSVRTNWPVWLAFGYFLVILVGSVHLGWHYASDGIVAIFGTTIIWMVSGWFVSSGNKKTEQAALGQLPMPAH